MDCPRCKATLKVRSIKDLHQDIEVDECPKCKGIWFDHEELQELELVTELTLWEVRRIPKKKEQLEALYCPKCEDHPLMKKAEHPRDERVILDYCETCNGIWLDGGELEAIQKEHWLIALRRLFRKMQ